LLNAVVLLQFSPSSCHCGSCPKLAIITFLTQTAFTAVVDVAGVIAGVCYWRLLPLYPDDVGG
jgi:hypothetical protein